MLGSATMLSKSWKHLDSKYSKAFSPKELNSGVSATLADIAEKKVKLR